MEDEKRSLRSKYFQDEELEALLDADYCQTQEKTAKFSRVKDTKRLKAAG